MRQQKGITQVVNLSGSGRAKKPFTHRGRGLVQNFHGTIFTFQLPLAIVLCMFKLRNVHRCNAPQKKKLDGYRCFYSDCLPTCPNHAFPWFFMIKPWLSHGFSGHSHHAQDLCEVYPGIITSKACEVGEGPRHDVEIGWNHLVNHMFEAIYRYV